MRCPLVRTLVLLLAVACFSAGAHADRESRDQDAVRQAVERGEIKALADILNAIRDRLPGNVVGVEIEREKGHLFYELRVVDPQGRLFEVHVDANSGEISRIKEK